jgi:hypothetical protein
VADLRSPTADATVEVRKPDAEEGKATDEKSLVGVG